MSVMAHQVVWEKVSVTKAGATEDTIVHRGALLPDWVDDFTCFVLTSTGAVKTVDNPDPGLRPVEAGPRPVLLQEHRPEQFGLEEEVVSDEEAPAKSASKSEWVDYAVAQGASREDAEASTKDELVSKYGG